MGAFKGTTQPAMISVVIAVIPFQCLNVHQHKDCSVVIQKTFFLPRLSGPRIFSPAFKLIRLYKEVSIFSIKNDDQEYFCSSLRLKKYTGGEKVHCSFYRTSITVKLISANRVKRKSKNESWSRGQT